MTAICEVATCSNPGVWRGRACLCNECWNKILRRAEINDKLKKELGSNAKEY
jgi:hypothetical protein